MTEFIKQAKIKEQIANNRYVASSIPAPKSSMKAASLRFQLRESVAGRASVSLRRGFHAEQ